jgi:hypothetical protein
MNSSPKAVQHRKRNKSANPDKIQRHDGLIIMAFFIDSNVYTANHYPSMASKQYPVE